MLFQGILLRGENKSNCVKVPIGTPGDEAAEHAERRARRAPSTPRLRPSRLKPPGSSVLRKRLLEVGEERHGNVELQIRKENAGAEGLEDAEGEYAPRPGLHDVRAENRGRA